MVALLSSFFVLVRVSIVFGVVGDAGDVGVGNQGTSSTIRRALPCRSALVLLTPALVTRRCCVDGLFVLYALVSSRSAVESVRVCWRALGSFARFALRVLSEQS